MIVSKCERVRECACVGVRESVEDSVRKSVSVRGNSKRYSF